MEKEDWLRVAKWIGYVYLPIVLLIAGIFLLVQWQSKKVDDARTETVNGVSDKAI